jgi:hypothetical protein
MGELAVAAVPGKWMVDFFPFCELRHISPKAPSRCSPGTMHRAVTYVPSWFPGATFKRIAKEYRRHLDQFSSEPLAFVKREMVRI